MKTPHAQRGFTLIEMLVVISIISLLSSIIFVSMSIARAKARDTQKLADAAMVRIAIQKYVSANQAPPPVYACSGSTCTVVTTMSAPAVGDGSNSASDRAYQAIMTNLVNEKFLPRVPKSPDNTPYTYMDYGIGHPLGIVFSVVTQSASQSSNSSSVPNYSSQCLIPAKFYDYTSSGSAPFNVVEYKMSGSTCYIGVRLDGSVAYYEDRNTAASCMRPPLCVQYTNSNCGCVQY